VGGQELVVARLEAGYLEGRHPRLYYVDVLFDVGGA
jgi:hypothetical protein